MAKDKYRFWDVSKLPGFSLPEYRPKRPSGKGLRAAGGVAFGTLPGSPAWEAQQKGGAPAPPTTPAAPPTAQQPAYTPPTTQPSYEQQPGFDYSQITGMFEQAMAEANRANEARYQQGLGIYGQIADIYAPGGGFGAGYEAQLERTKTRDVASAQQQMVSSGLWGTTVAAALPSAWEETVGQPSRLALQDVQMGRYGEALAGQAGFIERRADIGPDMGLFAGLMQGAYAGPMGAGGMGGGQGGGQVGGQVGGARYGTPPAGGGPTQPTGWTGAGSVPSRYRPNMGRTGTPQPGAAPVRTATQRPQIPTGGVGMTPGQIGGLNIHDFMAGGEEDFDWSGVKGLNPEILKSLPTAMKKRVKSKLIKQQAGYGSRGQTRYPAYGEASY